MSTEQPGPGPQVSDAIAHAADVLHGIRYTAPAPGDVDAARQAWVAVAREVAYRLTANGVSLADLPGLVPADELTGTIARKSSAAALELALTQALGRAYAAPSGGVAGQDG